MGITLYHGTSTGFKEFSLDHATSNTGWSDSARGIYMTEDIGTAQIFGTIVMECNVALGKELDLNSIFSKPDQAVDIVKILFLEDLPKDEALQFLDDNIGLGEIEDLYDAFSNRDIIEEFMKLGYTHTVGRFADDKDEYCIFSVHSIQITKSNIVPSLSNDQVRVMQLQPKDEEILRNELIGNPDQLKHMESRFRFYIDSLPDSIDKIPLSDSKKLKILAGLDDTHGDLCYSIEAGKLYRTLPGRMDSIISPVFNLSIDSDLKLGVRR